LVRLFETWVGLTPKRFARVVRFQCALRAMEQPANGADLAARLGYADQAASPPRRDEDPPVCASVGEKFKVGYA
jgi:AraC-like DNA-binding protein